MGLTTLHIQRLSAGYHGRDVVHEVSLPPLRSGETVAVIGPNGAGKSTFLRRIAGFGRGGGTVELRDDDRSMVTRDRILYLPQDPPPRSAITVFDALEVAARLRHGPGGWIGEAAIARVLTELEIDELAGRRLAELSGGQRQLVALGQALVRTPDVLLLDEPTSSLDLRNQLEVLRIMKDIARRQPATVIAVVHDLGLAARFADRIILLHDGRLHATGSPRETITRDMLNTVYRVDGTVHLTQDGTMNVSASASLPRSPDKDRP